MMDKNKCPRLISFILVSICLAVPVRAAVDNDASVVHLRTSCQENTATIPNCFTSSGAVASWISTTSTANAVTVRVGPGSFGFFSLADGRGNVSVHGAGPGLTFISGMQFRNAFNIDIQDLTITNWFPAPVYWFGTGTSNWSNVHLDGNLYGWTETACEGLSARPVHYWFASRITAKSKTAYQAGCSENWFIGTELSVKGNGMSGVGMSALLNQAGASYEPESHIYGGVLRVVVNSGVTYPPGQIAAVKSHNGGQVHIHGTGIDVIGNDESNDIAALSASNGGTIHANQSSYVLKTGSGGLVHRILNNGGTVKAPYDWEDISSTPLLTDLRSADGADSFVEPDCSANGCQSAGNEPHLLLYSSGCTGAGGPWFDVVTGQCR